MLYHIIFVGLTVMSLLSLSHCTYNLWKDNQVLIEREKNYQSQILKMGKEIKDGELEAAKRKEELIKLSKKEKEFDWNADISSSPLVKQLHKD